MGLKDSIKRNSDRIKSDIKKKNSNSSDSKSDKYPKFDYKVPRLAVIEEDGELVAKRNPQDVQIEFIKKTEHKRWELHWVPEDVERYWMSDIELKRLHQIVDRELGEDVFELLSNDAEKGLRAIRHAAKRTPRERKSMTESCPVCGKENHLVYGDFEKVNNRRVCSDHSIQELKEAGVIGETPI